VEDEGVEVQTMLAPHALAAVDAALDAAPDTALHVSLDAADLALVTGGEAKATGAAGAQPSSDFGRCGPGSSWKWLGNVYTPECAAHDAAVRGRLANGSSNFMAHAKSLPLLPAAVGSYVRERLR
jgi:hypothetical protein